MTKCITAKCIAAKVKAVLALLLQAALLLTCIVSVRAADEDRLISDYMDEFRAGTKCKSVGAVVVRGNNAEIYGDAGGLYRIGSMTKAFTGLGIQKLISDGLIDEDDNISEWIPGFTAYYDGESCEITIRRLLEQTSGYTNKESDYPGATEEMSLMEWAESIAGRELNSKPGTEYAYSNANYNLLGAVIEQAAGKTYKEYMETEILKPLGLVNTYVQLAAEDARVIPGSRLGYRRCFTYTISVAPGQIPAGYFYSNAADMARWICIWMGMADIPEEYKELVCSVKERLKNTGDYYSGWEFFENGTIGHSGGTPDYSSRIVFSDKEKIGVCVLTNLNVAASTDSLCNGIYATSAGRKFGMIQTDVWTFFDNIFTAVTVMGLLFIAMSVGVKHRGILIGAECFLIILLISVCTVMPLAFGAGLGKIMITWAPYSFAGGLFMLAAGALAIAIKLWMMRKNEN